ncbi:hypothetical protein BAE44_0008951 [Dichanthelium oligosanthes]|uniref:Uncharacterized protein n=1 Tax=Dichanthelium oligosanthes TaxID=888268 RepID=A0A1E5VY34_9POAL|nr:hypothetical protein BAE44_0008951 [Dichanthelium oligosanthes]
MVFAFVSGGGSGVAADVLTARFARQVLSGRWFTLFACLLILSASGATYAFGIYSRALRSSLGYDQRAVATLAFFKDLGSNVGVPAGLLNEVAPPWAVLAVGAAMNLAGYLMVYLSLAGRVARPPPVWLMCAYVCAGANSQAFAGTGALVTCVRNFPETRGAVLGLLKGYVGLSSAILAQVYLALYGGGDARSLVLLIAWLPAAVSVVFLGTVRVMPPYRQRQSASRVGGGGDVFFCLLYISIALATYILVMIVVQRQASFSRAAYAASATGLLVLLFLPLAVVVKQEYRIKKELEESLRAAPTTVTVVEKPTAVPMSEPVSTDTPLPPPRPPSSYSCLTDFLKHTFNPPAHGEDYSIPQALVSVDMLILFLTITCGAGGTLTAIDNMGQIGQSLGYPTKSVDAFVSLISVWNYAGRVTAGYVSEALLSRYRFPRPLALTLVLLLSCAGHLLITFGAPRGTLYAASVLIGFCFGAQWPLLYAVISELFGLKRYPTLYNLGAVASPVGAYVLNVRVAGRFYDSEAARQHGGSLAAAGGDKTCVGVECFRRSFLIITAATVAGALVSLVLVWRTREFYRGDIYAKFRDAALTEESPGDSGLGVEQRPGQAGRGGGVNGRQRDG